MLLVLCLIGSTLILQAKEIKILSPDKKTELTITIGLKNENELSYSIFYRGSPIIASSPLGLEFENEKPLSRDLTVVSDNEKMVKENWKPVYGEKDNYLNHYKEVTIQFKERKTPYRLFSLTMLEKNGQAMVIRPIK